MKWNIVTDSACDLMPGDRNGIGFSGVPFIIQVGEKDFVDDERLDVSAMMDAMERNKEASRTACPSPGAWVEEFEKAEQTIAVTISGRLSGSFNSAMAAREIVLAKQPEKKIAVIDSASTGPEIVMCVQRLFQLIESGLGFEEILPQAQSFLDQTHIVFILSAFDNLIKNGRMLRILGFIAQKLGVRGVGVGSDAGEIEMKGKTRGAAKALELLVEDMRQRGFGGGQVVISHCMNLEYAEHLRQKLLGLWHTAKVTILPARGLDSYYAERGGLIVAYHG